MQQLIYQNMLELLEPAPQSMFTPRTKADWVAAAKSWRCEFKCFFDAFKTMK